MRTQAIRTGNVQSLVTGERMLYIVWYSSIQKIAALPNVFTDYSQSYLNTPNPKKKQDVTGEWCILFLVHFRSPATTLFFPSEYFSSGRFYPLDLSGDCKLFQGQWREVFPSPSDWLLFLLLISSHKILLPSKIPQIKVVKIWISYSSTAMKV